MAGAALLLLLDDGVATRARLEDPPPKLARADETGSVPLAGDAALGRAVAVTPSRGNWGLPAPDVLVVFTFCSGSPVVAPVREPPEPGQ